VLLFLQVAISHDVPCFAVVRDTIHPHQFAAKIRAANQPDLGVAAAGCQETGKYLCKLYLLLCGGRRICAGGDASVRELRNIFYLRQPGDEKDIGGNFCHGAFKVMPEYLGRRQQLLLCSLYQQSATPVVKVVASQRCKNSTQQRQPETELDAQAQPHTRLFMAS
jgi:hypothetical protein